MTKRIKGYLASGATVLGLVCIGYGAMQTRESLPQTDTQFANKAVAILAVSQRSGGTGVIMKSGPAGSEILTNKHVCQLVQNGGLVKDENDKTYKVKAYRVYTPHDLCLVYVDADLHNNTVLAKTEPKLYSPVTVTGHPALLPSIISRGHFSKIINISVVVDFKTCDGTETDEEAMMCFFMGGKPVMKEYAAQATSALIMPGSSGSGVFNDRGELSGLVFAGSQDLSYSFIVPWSFVQDFLTHQDTYKLETPNAKKTPRSFFTAYFQMEKMCANKGRTISYDISRTCKSIKNLGIYHD